MPRLLVIPIGDLDTASSRLRVHALLNQLGRRVSADVMAPGATDSLCHIDPTGYDLLYVQKDAREPVLELCRRVAAAGKPILYDIDDDFGVWPGMCEAALCRLASCVIVDSPGRAEALARQTGRRALVLPAMIDMAEDPARGVVRTDPRPFSVVGTFGNLESLTHTVPYFRELPATVSSFVIGSPEAAELFPSIPLIPFDRQTFVSSLASADAVLLAHDPEVMPRKSNIRLVLAMSMGIPAITSPSASYLADLTTIGLGKLAIGPSQVRERLSEVSDVRIRAAIAPKLEAYAWKHYGPELCATRFLQVVQDLIAHAHAQGGSGWPST